MSSVAAARHRLGFADRALGIAIEHGSKVLGLLLQVGTTAAPNMSDADAQSAIRKAQAVTSSGN